MRRIKCVFFAGGRLDRAGVISRKVLEGWTILILPSPRAKDIPLPGEKWEVELEKKAFAVFPERKTAVRLALPIRKIPTRLELRQASGFEEKLSIHRSAKPKQGGAIPDLTLLSPPKPKPAPDRKRDKRLRDQQIRVRLKGPQRSDDSRGHSRQKRA